MNEIHDPKNFGEWRALVNDCEAQIAALRAERDTLRKDAGFLADVWVTIRTNGYEYIDEHGDPDGVDFVAAEVLNKLIRRPEPPADEDLGTHVIISGGEVLELDGLQTDEDLEDFMADNQF